MDQVKRKARIQSNDFDADIDALIEEALPSIRLKLSTVDEENIDVVATVNLGALEIIAGMFLQEHANLEDQDNFSIADLKFGETKQAGSRLERGQELEAKGWQRLDPYVQGSYFAFEVM